MAKLRAFAVLFVIQCIISRITGTKYRMLERNVTMDEAPDHCQLATPALHYTESGIRLNVTTDELYPDDGEKFWLGYVKVFQAFQYRGCAPVSDMITKYMTHSLKIGDETAPGTCASFCGTAKGHMIGLSRWTCYCLPSFSASTDSLTNGRCSQKCLHQDGALCGARQIVSIYEKVEYLPSTNNPIDDVHNLCLSWNADLVEYAWSTCSAAHRYVCQQDESDNTDENRRIFNSWSLIMQQCLKDDHEPASRNSQTDFVKIRWEPNTTLWIGEVRDLVIVEDPVNSKEIAVQRGYMVLERGVFYLGFGGDTEQHDAVCNGEKTTGSSSSSSSSSSPLTTTYAATTTATSTATVNDVSTVATASHEETTLNGSENRDEFTSTTAVTTADTITSMPDVITSTAATATHDATTNGGVGNRKNVSLSIVAVAVIVPVMLIAILVVIVVWIVRKRSNNPKKGQPGHEMETRDEMRTEHNDTTGETDRYFTLEPTGHGNTRQMAPPGDDVVYDTAEERAPLENDNRAPLCPAQNDNRMNNRPASDDTYNVTTDNAGHGKQPTENIYNKTDAVDDTYDHTGATPSQVHQTDNVYNMTESGDIYNQTGVSPDRTVQTDNVYNITDTDDTYSHTDKKPNCAPQTDNVYN